MIDSSGVHWLLTFLPPGWRSLCGGAYRWGMSQRVLSRKQEPRLARSGTTGLKELWAPYQLSTTPTPFHFWVFTYNDHWMELMKREFGVLISFLEHRTGTERWNQGVSVTQAHEEPHLEHSLYNQGSYCATPGTQAPLNAPVAYTKKPRWAPRFMIVNKYNGSFIFRKDLGHVMEGVRKSAC